MEVVISTSDFRNVDKKHPKKFFIDTSLAHFRKILKGKEKLTFLDSSFLIDLQQEKNNEEKNSNENKLK